jgi:hypothetical protein
MDSNSFTPVSNISFSLCQFSQNSQAVITFLGTFPVLFYSNQMKNVENVGKISFTSLGKVWLELLQFSQNSKLLNRIM